MEENEVFKQLMEEDRQRRKKANELGTVIGLALAALWVAAFTWRGDFDFIKFLLSFGGGVILVAIPYALGHALGESLYDPWNKGKKGALIAATVVINFFALHYLGLF